MPRIMAYIDGFSLYYSLKGRAWEKYLWLNVDALARQIARPEGGIVLVKYFTAMVHPTPGDPDKANRQARYIAALRAFPKYGSSTARTNRDRGGAGSAAQHGERSRKNRQT